MAWMIICAELPTGDTQIEISQRETCRERFLELARRNTNVRLLGGCCLLIPLDGPLQPIVELQAALSRLTYTYTVLAQEPVWTTGQVLKAV